MALYPIQANERDAVGLFKAASSFTGGEGGLVVKLTKQGTTTTTPPSTSRPVVSYVTGSEAAYTAPNGLFGLLDEQMVRPETLVGSFLSANRAPLGIGPATYLGSGRLTIWQNAGYFMTDYYAIQVNAQGPADGYGEPTTLSPGDALLATAANATDVNGNTVWRGTLCDAASAAALSVATKATRCTFMGMAVHLDDLMYSAVSPAPTNSLFALAPRALLYQA